MKLSALLESPPSKTPELDWLVKTLLNKRAIFGGESQAEFDERLKAFEESKFSAFQFFMETKNDLFDSEEREFINSVKIAGGKVSCVSFVLRTLDECGPPPFTFGKIQRTFAILGSNTLTKPEHWFPSDCECLRISACPNFVFTGIEKVIKNCAEIGFFGDHVKGSVLGLLKINNLNFVRIEVNNGGDYDVARTNELQTIILKHLPNSSMYEGGDVLDLQTELFVADFIEFTK